MEPDDRFDGLDDFEFDTWPDRGGKSGREKPRRRSARTKQRNGPPSGDSHRGKLPQNPGG